MAGAGELVPRPALRGEVLPPATPVPGGGRGGSVYADFMGRVRDYVAPPPPGELGWQACIGVGTMLGSAGLLALLPSGHTIASGGLFRWVSASGVASMADSASALVAPLALFAMVMLLGVAAIYLTEWGATPALFFLTAQSWLGIAAFAVVVIVWVYLIAVFVINVVIWILYGLLLLALAILALIILGLFAGS
jgi:hypothetical protein